MKRRIFGALVVAGFCTPAFAYSDAQMAVMSHVGQAIAGTKICSKAEISEGSVALMLATHQVKLDDPTVAAVIRGKVEETVAAWRGKDEQIACAAVLMLYGQNGSNVPGLLRVKD